MTSKFSSEGFDLDTASSGDVILEVGGGSTKVDEMKTESSLVAKSEEWKQKGNDCFRQGAYLEAFDMYTEAIESCPGMTGDELLKEKAKHEEQQHSEAMEAHRRSMNEPDKKDEKESFKAEPYKPPMHVYGDKLATYHSNRAAVGLHLNQYEDVIRDCDIAILLNPSYTKPYMRRSAAYEKTERTEEALQDAKAALQLDPTNANTRKTVTRLQKLEDQRLEELKTETMGKLKDLGNSILGNFGLSIDNFNAVQGPDGSYSVNFNQNA
mmetsp:Transcript_1629/g.2399  ORF Transcript_1629/g.2399 Transcript_1629/m.2399 type:complete len:267 (+) Transcript_1629:79-879(+)